MESQERLKRASKNTYETVIKLVKKINPKKILDLGSGYGGLVEALAKNGFDVTASDLHPENFRLKHVNCVKINLNEKVSFPKKYDLITCTEVVEHLENPSNLFLSAHALLEKNGTLIVTTPNNQNWFSRLYFFLTGKLPAMCNHPDHRFPVFTWQIGKLTKGMFEIKKIYFNRSVVPVFHFNLPFKNLFFGQNLILVFRKK
ncbi:class I SAM-dependent methyltransferase [Candidatus Woesearchaeota archaeon]|nr:class I SAM-dependent methyltransferase [Candidatus Woesearchaeota archaeon]